MILLRIAILVCGAMQRMTLRAAYRADRLTYWLVKLRQRRVNDQILGKPGSVKLSSEDMAEIYEKASRRIKPTLGYVTAKMLEDD